MSGGEPWGLLGVPTPREGSPSPKCPFPDPGLPTGLCPFSVPGVRSLGSRRGTLRGSGVHPFTTDHWCLPSSRVPVYDSRPRQRGETTRQVLRVHFGSTGHARVHPRVGRRKSVCFPTARETMTPTVVPGLRMNPSVVKTGSQNPLTVCRGGFTDQNR